ncbi:hypothetical protein B0H13DRAFT_1965372 [Mycena leptocephala]|nr:hypothetical protein B0H13DRAFT_1965372 [Mycena leptocephala]
MPPLRLSPTPSDSDSDNDAPIAIPIHRRNVLSGRVRRRGSRSPRVSEKTESKESGTGSKAQGACGSARGDGIEENVESRMERAMREAQEEDEGDEEDDEDEMSDDLDEEIPRGEDGDGESDEEDEDEQMPSNPDHLPDHLFTSAFASTSAPSLKKPLQAPKNFKRKRTRASKAKDLVVGSRIIRIASTTAHPIPATLPSRKIRKFTDRALALKGGAKKKAWTRMPANLGVMRRSLPGPPVGFVRNPSAV